MAKSLKTNGLAEIRAFRSRAIRQYGLKRIAKEDHDKLVALANEAETIIIGMHEEGEEPWH